jgi:hypothetical protein
MKAQQRIGQYQMRLMQRLDIVRVCVRMYWSR